MPEKPADVGDVRAVLQQLRRARVFAGRASNRQATRRLSDALPTDLPRPVDKQWLSAAAPLPKKLVEGDEERGAAVEDRDDRRNVGEVHGVASRRIFNDHDAASIGQSTVGVGACERFGADAVSDAL